VGRASNRKKAQRQAGQGPRQATSGSFRADAETQQAMYQLAAGLQALVQETNERLSDWKNDYLDICRSCSVQDACGGVFTTSGKRLSQHLRPVPGSGSARYTAACPAQSMFRFS
jgi:hypothetical protein